MKIALTSVLVDDPAKAFKFYTEVLGFVERMYIPEAQLAIVVSPEEPLGTGLLLEPNDNPIAKPFQEAIYQQGLPSIVFGVEDIQEACGVASILANNVMTELKNIHKQPHVGIGRKPGRIRPYDSPSSTRVG